MSKWTSFMDMHSGGSCKEKPYEYIYIEAPIEEAKLIFFNKFGHDPDRVTCTCCGNDYSIDEAETLEQSTAFNRGCSYAYFDKDGNEVDADKAWVTGKGLVNGCVGKYVERQGDKFSFNKYQPLKDYLKKKNVLVIRKGKIKNEWRKGSVRKQGYVWVD